MSPVASLCVYLVVGCIGGLLGLWSRLPTGTLLGAVLAVVGFKIFMHTSWQTPRTYAFFCQVLLGVLIGLAFQPSMLPLMRQLLVPMVLSTFALIVCGAIIALVIVKWYDLSMSTAYIATSPGGMVALVPMAIDVNVNATLIACFHFLRIFTVVCTAPLVFKIIKNLH